MSLGNAASMPRVRARQPDTARAAFIDHTSIDAKPWRNLSHRGAPFASAFCPIMATSYRIVERHYTAIYAPFPSATQHSVTPIPGNTSGTPHLGSHSITKSAIKQLSTLFCKALMPLPVFTAIWFFHGLNSLFTFFMPFRGQEPFFTSKCTLFHGLTGFFTAK